MLWGGVHSIIHQSPNKIFKNSGSIPRNACVACVALKSVTDGQTDGQSDP